MHNSQENHSLPRRIPCHTERYASLHALATKKVSISHVNIQKV